MEMTCLKSATVSQGRAGVAGVAPGQCWFSTAGEVRLGGLSVS